MKDQKCGNCKHHEAYYIHEGKIDQEVFWYCNNPECDAYTEDTDYIDGEECPDWEGKDE